MTPLLKKRVQILWSIANIATLVGLLGTVVGLIRAFGAVTIRSAVVSALLAWGGFVVTTILVNYSFGGRRYLLTAIDAGHWLIVLVLMVA